MCFSVTALLSSEGSEFNPYYSLQKEKQMAMFQITQHAGNQTPGHSAEEHAEGESGGDESAG